MVGPWGAWTTGGRRGRALRRWSSVALTAVLVSTVTGPGAASQSVDGTYVGQFQDAVEQPVSGAATNEVTLVLGADLTGTMALATDATFNTDTSEDVCLSVTLDLAEQPVSLAYDETGGITFDQDVTLTVGFAYGTCREGGAAETEGRPGHLSGRLDEAGNITGVLNALGIDFPFLAVSGGAGAPSDPLDDPIASTPLTADELQRVRLASTCVDVPCPAQDAAKDFFMKILQPPNDNEVSDAENDMITVVYLRELKRPDGSRLFPSIHALTPVLFNLGAKGDKGDERAADALQRLIRMLITIDMAKLP